MATINPKSVCKSNNQCKHIILFAETGGEAGETDKKLILLINKKIAGVK